MLETQMVKKEAFGRGTAYRDAQRRSSRGEGKMATKGHGARPREACSGRIDGSDGWAPQLLSVRPVALAWDADNASIAASAKEISQKWGPRGKTVIMVCGKGDTTRG